MFGVAPLKERGHLINNSKRKHKSRWSAHCFRTLFGMLSGPDALEGFIFRRSFATPSCVILMFGMFCWILLCVLGILLTSQMYPVSRKGINMLQKIIDQYRSHRYHVSY
jgi:hypothetical protein